MTMFAPFRSQATAYGHVQVETGVSGADPHKLVEMLYDGAIDAMARARGALARGDIEAKGKAIGQAVRIIEEGLRAALNHQQGGEVAENLNNVYLYITARLTHANLRNDDAALQECVKLLTPIREAWVAMKPAARP
ncbi:flagellar export chaperone FliS [Caldimonas caldifontis]|jgi:flagellar protein FliS|uniref:Flagellar secretion chaperone FliS n=2 Tax=Caldimonas caldifontis TaxID=1452508 RepID=A0A2S5SZ33_9BURK|nr:flagellar export chaperone FliS [Caldimonas caldifontis]PPE67857.1 flagellar export chaperone FliS [Caldimonas caldifontis]